MTNQPRLKKARTETVTVRVTKEQKARLKSMARKDGVSAAMIVFYALRLYGF